MKQYYYQKHVPGIWREHYGVIQDNVVIFGFLKMDYEGWVKTESIATRRWKISETREILSKHEFMKRTFLIAL